MDYNETYYEQDAAGSIVEVRFVEGRRVHVSVDPGLQFEPIRDKSGQATGRFRAIRSEEARRAARDKRSHDAFMYGTGADFSADSPAEARQTMRRISKLATGLNTMFLDRVAPTTVPGVERIKDHEFERLHAMYHQAVAEGREKECEFQPLSAYIRKLEILNRNGVKRPLLQGEVGMRGSKILCLEEGYGVGDRVSVVAKVGE